MKVTDEKLFEDFRRGSAEGFEQLLDRYKAPLFSMILKRVRDADLAQDIFQETFMRVIERADTFERGRKFSPWVFRIASNLCVDYYRKARTRSEVGMDRAGAEPIDGAAVEEKMEDRETREKIQAALDVLTEEQRQVFIMREYSGMSFKEIAEATESNLNTVLGRMHAAIKKLRVELADQLADQRG